MSNNIIKFPDRKYAQRVQAVKAIESLVITTGCQDELTGKLEKLVKLMRRNNHAKLAT